ncbi:MAG: hypothetical protein WCK65_02190 [Rhodospirillaceae bacterium]
MSLPTRCKKGAMDDMDDAERQKTRETTAVQLAAARQYNSGNMGIGNMGRASPPTVRTAPSRHRQMVKVQSISEDLRLIASRALLLLGFCRAKHTPIKQISSPVRKPPLHKPPSVALTVPQKVKSTRPPASLSPNFPPPNLFTGLLERVGLVIESALKRLKPPARVKQVAKAAKSGGGPGRATRR